MKKLDMHDIHFLVDMLESVDMGLVILDSKLRVQLWNGFMENHSGVTWNTVRDNNLFELFPDLPQKWLTQKIDTAITLNTRAFTSWRLRPYLFRFANSRPITGTTPYMYQNVTITPLSEYDGSINRVCLMIYDVTDVASSRLALEAANQQLAQLSVTDNLTGLLNRGAWEVKLNEEFARNKRYGNPSSLLMLDIDHFKKVNDQYGHPVGDDVIRHLATLLRTSFRSADSPGRYGGEEFAVVLPETSVEEAKILAERLRQTIADAHVSSHGHQLNYNVSIGVACITETLTSASQWLKAADQALYDAKNNGRNQVCVATGYSQ